MRAFLLHFYYFPALSSVRISTVFQHCRRAFLLCSSTQCCTQCTQCCALLRRNACTQCWNAESLAEYVVKMRASPLGVAEYVVNMRASPLGVAEYVVKMRAPPLGVTFGLLNVLGSFLDCFRLVLGFMGYWAAEGCRAAELQGCRAAGLQGCGAAGLQGCRSAGLQHCLCAFLLYSGTASRGK